ncbi:unnamed protein product [Gongylonema pulchrum]|uniref:RNA polymerase II transcription elongation factor n=1 Tax=Gongylonema pulchrum TaxID=637853 RepID=A0A183D4P4_9BILA|nr:unnamed protein product [Gongylonema pulchrum]
MAGEFRRNECDELVTEVHGESAMIRRVDDKDYRILLERLDELEKEEKEADEHAVDESSSLDSDDFPDDVDQDILPHAFNDVNKEAAGEVKVEAALVEKDCPKEANNNKSMERRTVRFKSEDEAYSAVASPDTPSISQGSSSGIEPKVVCTFEYEFLFF